MRNNSFNVASILPMIHVGQINQSQACIRTKLVRVLSVHVLFGLSVGNFSVPSCFDFCGVALPLSPLIWSLLSRLERRCIGRLSSFVLTPSIRTQWQMRSLVPTVFDSCFPLTPSGRVSQTEYTSFKPLFDETASL